MKILALGCGTKACSHSEVINIDWSIYLRVKRNIFLKPIASLFVNGERRKKFDALPGNIMVHNILKGLPFADNSIDVVYHSHMLEHFDREAARRFLMETRRVLKPGGAQRIVVPDLEKLCRNYLAHVDKCETDLGEIPGHDGYVASLYEQCVRKEASGSSHQRPVRRFVENMLLGDARARGEIHQWMYDRFNLRQILGEIGFNNFTIQKYNTSLIPRWNEYELDLNDQHQEYKPESVYMEVRK